MKTNQKIAKKNDNLINKIYNKYIIKILLLIIKYS